MLLLAIAAGATAWAALTPIRSTSREVLFEIPKGTWARRMAGNKLEILPSTIRLTLGLKDILVLKNLDDVPQVFGPDTDDARAELPVALCGRGRLSVCLHRTRQRADEHRCRAEAGIALGPRVVAVAVSVREAMWAGWQTSCFPRWR